MQTRRLGDVAVINPRFDRGVSDDDLCSFVPMEAVNEHVGRITSDRVRRVADVQKGYTPFREGDVLFAKITPCMENGKSAVARGLVNGVGFGSTEFHVIRLDADILPDWILRFLRLPPVRLDAEQHMTGSAGQRRVPSSYLEDLLFPCPALADQRSALNRLESADRLRHAYGYARLLSESLVQSLFLDMFGAPATNDWPLKTVEDLLADHANAIHTGPFGSQLLHSEFVDHGVAVLGIDNVVQNRFAWGERRYITLEKYRQLHRYTVRPKDVLITIMGTPGRCCVVPDGIPTSITSKHLCSVTLDRDSCHPLYFQACFLYHPLVLRQLGVSERGSVMPGLNMAIIRELAIPLAPMSLQQRFVDTVEAFRWLEVVQSEAERQADHLFQSLLHRTFASA